MPIQLCPRCQTRVNVPEGRGQLRVKCPNCERSWFSPPWTEASLLDFKCSLSGQPFVVRLSRRDPDARFTIEDCLLIDNTPAPRAGDGSTSQKLLAGAGRLKEILGLPDPNAKAVKGWLVDLARQGATSFGIVDPPAPDTHSFAHGLDDASVISRSGDQYDWTAFLCPCCASDSLVLRCSKCGSFGCQGTAEDRPGGRFWQCSCGHSCFLTSGGPPGVVKEKKRLPGRPLLAREKRLALPAPEQRRLPPPRRFLPPPARS